MKAEDIVIIHLSDLHITETGLRPVHEDLINDLSEQIQQVKQLVVVVTGDIVDQGEVDRKREHVKVFFEKVKNIIPQGCQLLYFGITPGNHDYTRAERKTEFNHGSYRPDTSKFELVLSEIYNIFGISEAGRYGVDVAEYDGKKLCFVRIDSSWHETSEVLMNRAMEKSKSDDETKSIYGKLVEEIQHELLNQRTSLIDGWMSHFDSAKGNQPYLTFVLSHFPLTWLCDTSKGDARKFLSGKGLKSVNFWLCGHLHSAKIRHVQDNGFQMTTLMSGIGNEDMNERSQRYSIYRLSLERNLCAIQIRVSQPSGGFDCDRNIEADVADSEDLHIMIPLKPDRKMSMLALHTVVGMENCGCAVDQSMLLSMKNAHEAIADIAGDIKRRCDFAAQRIVDHIAEVNNELSDSIFEWYKSTQCEVPESIRTLIFEAIISCNMYDELLRNICADIYYRVSKSMCSDLTSIPIWRVHCRRYVGQVGINGELENDCYRLIVAASDLDKEDPLNKAKDVAWGGVMEAAYKHPRGMLVNSVNPGLNKTMTEWDDFMTIIPPMKVNHETLIVKGGTRRAKIVRPIFTLGISMMADDFCGRKEASRMLYSLEFFDINNVLTNGIQTFLNKCGVDTVEKFKEAIDLCER